MSAIANLWYTVLVRLFPADFRAEFGREVKAVILEQRANLWVEGPVQLLWFHVTATADLVRAAAMQWRPAILRLMSAIVLIAALANVGYDLAHPKLSMGYFAWGLTLIAVASSGLMFSAAERRRRHG
jgi:hypothetical protein